MIWLLIDLVERQRQWLIELWSISRSNESVSFLHCKCLFRFYFDYHIPIRNSIVCQGLVSRCLSRFFQHPTKQVADSKFDRFEKSNLLLMREAGHLIRIFSKGSLTFDVLPFRGMCQCEKLKLSLPKARDELKSGKAPKI